MKLKYLILAISILLPNLAFSADFGDMMTDKASKIRLSDPWGFFGASPAIVDDPYGRYASPPNVQSALMELGASQAVVDSTFAKLDGSNQPFTGTATAPIVVATSYASAPIVYADTITSTSSGAPNFSAGLISSGAGDVQIGTSSVVSDIYFANAQADIKGNGTGTYTIGQTGETWNLRSTGATYNFGNITFPIDSDFTLSGGVNALSFDGTTFSVDATNNRIGLGTATPSYDMEIIHNQNAETSISISNTTAGTASVAGLRLIEDTSRGGSFFLTSSSYTGVTGYADVVWIDAGTSTANGIILSAAKSTADINFYAGGRTSSDLALTLNDTLAAAFTGVISTSGGVTGAAPTAQFTMGSYYDNAGAPSVSHIGLYGTTVGFGVSGTSLDYISGTGNNHTFYANPASAAIFTLNGTTNAATFVGTLAVNGDTITCDSGTLSFDNENLLTTGTLGAGAITGTSFIIGANTLTTAEWAYLDGIAGYVYRAGGTDVAVADGGTNLSSYTVGDILYASAATTIASLADVATGSILVSGGIGVAPAYSASPTLTTSLTVPTIAATGDLTLDPAGNDVILDNSNITIQDGYSIKFTGTGDYWTLLLNGDTDTGWQWGTTYDLYSYLVNNTAIIQLDSSYVYAKKPILVGAFTANSAIWTSTNGTGSTTMYIGNATINVTASDERMKENVEPTKIDALKLIGQMDVVDFDWKENDNWKNRGRWTGLIAQDVIKYLPQVVNKPDDSENTWAVEYHHIVPYLIKSVQELDARVIAMEQKNLELENRVKMLEEKNE